MNYREVQDARWQRQLFRVCVYLFFIGLAAEIVIYLMDSSSRALFLPLPLYRFRFIYLPAALNALALAVTFFVLRAQRLSNGVKNACASFLIYFFCANIQVVHYVYGPLLMLPGIAIFVSTIFSNKKITLSVTIASILSLALAGSLASVELRKGDPQLLSDVGIAALVMIVMYITANLLINYTAQQINHILEGNERQRQLIEECNMDPLMGIGNRRALLEKFDRIRGSTAATRHPLLLIIDIDDFKRVNDAFGHPAGDEVLMRLGQLIKDAVRGNDRDMEVFRYGGEEIVMLFWNMGEASARSIANDLREAFHEIEFSFDKATRISFSGGMTTLSPDETPEAWISSADSRLYTAKTSGKNRIC